jgi:hypothetical protein
MDGPATSSNEIAVHFRPSYRPVYYYVMKLTIDGERLRQKRDKLVRGQVDRA